MSLNDVYYCERCSEWHIEGVLRKCMFDALQDELEQRDTAKALPNWAEKESEE